VSPSEQRSLSDRRQRPTPVLSRYWLRGRRRGGRRDHERWNIYVDRYSRGEWACVLGLLLLTAIDGLWTWAHLLRGVPEANPLLAWAWEQGGIAGFLTAKFAITVSALFVLLLHVRFRWTRRLLPLALVVYTALLAVHGLTELAIAQR